MKNDTVDFTTIFGVNRVESGMMRALIDRVDVDGHGVEGDPRDVEFRGRLERPVEQGIGDYAASGGSAGFLQSGVAGV